MATSDKKGQSIDALIKTLDDIAEPQCDDKTAAFETNMDSILDSSESEIIKFEPIQALVAFIDILGTSALMKSLSPKNATEIVKKITGIKKVFENNFIPLESQFSSSRLMVISDSYVISIEKKPDAFEALLRMLARCQYECLVKHDEVLRGGIAAGAIIGGSQDAAIIGPAFIRAHELEIENVIFPRIIVDESITKDKSIFSKNLPVILDKDGVLYLDFAHGEDVDIEILHTKIQSKCKDLLRKSKAGNLKIRQKWNWLNTFLEQKQKGFLNCCKGIRKKCVGGHYGI